MASASTLERTAPEPTLEEENQEPLDTEDKVESWSYKEMIVIVCDLLNLENIPQKSMRSTS